MGCDIHLFAEIRTEPGGGWEYVTPTKIGKLPPDEYDRKGLAKWQERIAAGEKIDRYGYEITAKDEQDEDDPRLGCYHDRWYSGRNYDLFAMLADVRNGRGFAGFDAAPTGHNRLVGTHRNDAASIAHLYQKIHP